MRSSFNNILDSITYNRQISEKTHMHTMTIHYPPAFMDIPEAQERGEGAMELCSHNGGPVISMVGLEQLSFSTMSPAKRAP